MQSWISAAMQMKFIHLWLFCLMFDIIDIQMSTSFIVSTIHLEISRLGLARRGYVQQGIDKAQRSFAAMSSALLDQQYYEISYPVSDKFSQLRVLSNQTTSTTAFGGLPMTFSMVDGDTLSITWPKQFEVFDMRGNAIDTSPITITGMIESLLSGTIMTATGTSASSQEEEVDWITSDGLSSIMPVKRTSMHKYNLFHRGIGLIVMNSKGEVFVHRRSSSKRLFPSMLDMFIGGVCSSNEIPYTTLCREAEEELGLSLYGLTLAKVFHRTTPLSMAHASRLRWFQERSQSKGTHESEVYEIGSTVIKTNYNHCLVHCYACLCSDELAKAICFNDGEIASGHWTNADELEKISTSKSKREEYVPDGLQVWDSLLNLISL
jgi:8-oxo-dGTP pyrophosphatase MutT (NUDIX family)